MNYYFLIYCSFLFQGILGFLLFQETTGLLYWTGISFVLIGTTMIKSSSQNTDKEHPSQKSKILQCTTNLKIELALVMCDLFGMITKRYASRTSTLRMILHLTSKTMTSQLFHQVIPTVKGLRVFSLSWLTDFFIPPVKRCKIKNLSYFKNIYRLLKITNEKFIL